MTDINPDTIADEFGIQGLGVDNGVPTLTTVPTSEQARELLLAMSLACGRMLDDDQAPNYVEFEVSPAGHPGYVVHVRRAGGPTPHTLRQEAESRVAELEAERETAVQLLRQALHLRCHGERAPGWRGRENETWAEWDRSVETFLDPERRAEQ